MDNKNDKGAPQNDIIQLYPDAKSTTSLEDGLEFQDYVRPLLLRYGILAIYNTSRKYQFEQGESVFGVEIKLDNRCTEFNRLSIEIGEKSKKSNANYVPSGILRNDNTWCYVQGNKEKFFVFSKRFLKQLWESGRYTEANKLPTIRRFYLPFADCEKYCLFSFEAENKASASSEEKAA